jgi:hypothetical protein
MQCADVHESGHATLKELTGGCKKGVELRLVLETLALRPQDLPSKGEAQ